MRAFARVIGWALLGALSVGTTAFAGFLLSYRMFEPSGDSEIRGWQEFVATMMGIGSAQVGFLLGAVYGIIRARRARSGLPTVGGRPV